VIGPLRKRTELRRICSDFVEDKGKHLCQLGLEENLQPFNRCT